MSLVHRSPLLWLFSCYPWLAIMTSLMDHDINVLYLWTSSELLPGEPIRNQLLCIRWLERDFKTSICSVTSSLQTRTEINWCLLRMSEWVLFIRSVELEISLVQFCFEKNLSYCGSMCYSNILSLCLIKVRDFMWKYRSKMSFSFITKRHVMVFESEMILSS